MYLVFMSIIFCMYVEADIFRVYHCCIVLTVQVENILSDTMGNYVLCDYGSCTVNCMHPESMGAAQCEDEIARFTTLAYRAPEMVSLYSGKTITTKADIWVSSSFSHTYVRTYVRTYVHTNIHTYIHTYIHKYVSTYIST